MSAGAVVPASARSSCELPSAQSTIGSAACLRKEDLHASLSHPILDTMNFLNEVTYHYPEAISFAPGRPYEGFFETEQIFTHLRGYLDHLAESGKTPGQIRDAIYHGSGS